MQHTHFIEHHLDRETLRYLLSQAVTISTEVVEHPSGKVDAEEVVRISFGASHNDPIEFAQEQSAQDAGTIIDVCSRNKLHAEDLWTLLCVGVG